MGEGIGLTVDGFRRQMAGSNAPPAGKTDCLNEKEASQTHSAMLGCGSGFQPRSTRSGVYVINLGLNEVFTIGLIPFFLPG